MWKGLWVDGWTRNLLLENSFGHGLEMLVAEIRLHI